MLNKVKSRHDAGKKSLAILFLTLIYIGANAQAPNWQWAKSAGGTSEDYSYSVSTDASGNVFMTGLFYSPAITFGTTTLTNVDTTGITSDIFIVKYDATGNVLWAKSAGGALEDFGYSVSTDASGNVFITGVFYSPSITFGTTTLTNAGVPDIFIVKYDTGGNVLWAKSAGGANEDYGTSVSTDASGNVFITGGFRSPSITFGTTTLTNVDTTGLTSDIFIVKYDATGNVLWAKSEGGAYGDESRSVSTDASGNVIMTGYFESSTITFGTTTLTNTGIDDIFLVKYDATGNVLWVKSAGGTSVDDVSSVSLGANGNVFIVGTFQSPTITFGTTTLTNAGIDDIFIVKYDATGNVVWAKSAGGAYEDFGWGASTDASGNVFITGLFYSASITFGTTTLTSAGNGDLFIVKYDATGNVVWAKSAGGTDIDRINSVSTDANDNVFVTGEFNSPSILFETTTLTNADTSSSSSDFFIAKLNGTTGIEELDNSMSLTIAPNPFTEQTTITFAEPQKNTTIKIMDVLGNVLLQSEIHNPKSEINMSGYAKGVYFLRIEDEKKNVMNRKIIKN